MTTDTSVSLSGVTLHNPIIPASGCFGFGYEFNEFYPIDKYLGSISIKGTTREPRFGNELPRVAECPEGLLNSVGLQNPGIHRVISEELPKLRSVYSRPIVANISGFSIDEYVECCSLIDSQEQVGIIELNVSCPNVHGGGMSFGTDPKCLAEVVREVRKVVSRPLYVKLTPNVTDIVAVARAAEEAGADGLVLINTLLGMRINLRSRRPVLANTMGGMSGPAVFPIALRMVWQVAHACSVPVIGCGGVSSADDLLEMMMAGASAVEIGAANLRNPYACRDIAEQLPQRMEALGIASLSELKSF